jgi:hypothetical protein
MDIALGIVAIGLGALAWGGQLLTWLAPRRAATLNLMEAENTVEPVYWADIRGEARWDSFTLWTLIAAGALLLVGNSSWAYFGIGGGCIYLYFAGRGIVTRLEMRSRGFRIGDPKNVTLGLMTLGAWGVLGLITVIAATNALATS